MVLDPIFPTCHDLTKKDGVKALTFSGKDVHIRKDEKGNIFVEDAPVKEVLSLDDGTQLYVLNKLLFDNFQKVRNIFNTRAASELAGPTGPPLDIDGTGSVPHSEDGNPASPTNDFGPVGPPAPPSAGFVGIEPPAPPPPELLGVRAPAPPPGFPAVGLPQDEPARFAVTVLPPAPPRTQESDSRIIFPSPEGEVRRVVAP
ncbi:hypothetical protein SK128_005113 [Halocaridina rubra]|uniref:Uncharacterized protein n=1 Tax=Halocaridina rubra TaxID=373956 RepID=A0AAN8XRG9_HALRR